MVHWDEPPNWNINWRFVHKWVGATMLLSIAAVCLLGSILQNWR